MPWQWCKSRCHRGDGRTDDCNVIAARDFEATTIVLWSYIDLCLGLKAKKTLSWISRIKRHNGCKSKWPWNLICDHFTCIYRYPIISGVYRKCHHTQSSLVRNGYQIALAYQYLIGIELCICVSMSASPRFLEKNGQGLSICFILDTNNLRYHLEKKLDIHMFISSRCRYLHYNYYVDKLVVSIVV